MSSLKVAALACAISLATATGAYAQNAMMMENGAPKRVTLTQSGMGLAMKHARKLPSNTWIIHHGGDFYAMSGDTRMDNGRMVQEELFDRAKGHIE